MNTDIYVLKAFYCGFCSIRHQPLDQNDVPDYLARRVQLKPRVECSIHGDICGFVVTTAKARAFPASVINGYIALNNAAHTVAVRHCETDHFLAGYRFFSFNSTEQQDYFINYLDLILDSHVSMFRRNSTSHYDYPMGRGNGAPAGQNPFIRAPGGSGMPPQVPMKPNHMGQSRVSDTSSLSNRSQSKNRAEGSLNIHNKKHSVHPR